MNDNKPLTKLQKKYINKMMNIKVKKTKEFDINVIKETQETDERD